MLQHISIQYTIIITKILYMIPHYSTHFTKIHALTNNFIIKLIFTKQHQHKGLL